VSIISGIARGFLSLLDSNNFGEQPRVLVEQIMPTVGMEDLYLLQKQRFVFGGTAGNLVAGFNSVLDAAGLPLIVPTGEIWKVFHVDASVVPAAAASGIFAPALQAEGTTVPLADSAPYVASTRAWSVAKVPAPWWIGAGVEVGVLAQSVAGATPAGIQLWCSKLKA
jgi:hypothetical protein